MGLDLYATLTSVKTALSMDSGSTYDQLVLQGLLDASRLVDRATGRTYNPLRAVRYLDGSGKDEQWLPDSLLELEELAITQDGGTTYTPVTAGKTWCSDGVNWDITPYLKVVLAPDANFSWFPSGRRTVRVTGLWGWRPRYEEAWIDSGDAVQDNSLSSSATQITVTSATGSDQLGLSPRFAIGQLLRVDTEVVEVTGVSSTKLTVVRGDRGTQAASHAKSTVLWRWEPFELASRAVLTQAARFFKRAQQAYADAGANAELGQLVYAKRLDPDVEVMLLEGGLRRLTVG